MKKLVPYACVVLICVIIALFADVVKPLKNTRVWQHEVSSINHCDNNEDEFCTHLPLVKINTSNQDVSENEVLAKIAIVDNEDGHNHFNDASKVETDMLIKIRGNSSSSFDKKQYRLTFVDSTNYDIKRKNVDELEHVSYKVMGMPAESEWVLNGPYLDKTCLRNYLMYNLSGEIMEWAPNVRYCEVFIDNNYQGLYLMIETVKADKNRVEIKMVNNKNPMTDYMVVRERVDETPYKLNSFGTYTNKTFNELGVVYPGVKSGRTNEQLEYIRQDISAFEKTLYSLDYDDQKIGYKSLIDIQSFVDYYILNEFSMNLDGGLLSTYMYKNQQKGFVMGPVWDFNNSFDNYENYTLKYEDFILIDKAWYYMLIKDEEFVEDVINRYHYLRMNLLDTNRLMGKIDEIIKYLGPVLHRNEEIWGYSYNDKRLLNFDLDGYEVNFDRNPKNYDDAVEQLKKCITERGAFLDEYIHVLRQFCAESKVKEWN